MVYCGWKSCGSHSPPKQRTPSIVLLAAVHLLIKLVDTISHMFLNNNFKKWIFIENFLLCFNFIILKLSVLTSHLLSLLQVFLLFLWRSWMFSVLNLLNVSISHFFSSFLIFMTLSWVNIYKTVFICIIYTKSFLLINISRIEINYKFF